MVLGSLCFAQPQSGTLSRAVVTHVKPEMLNEWLDLQKNEMIPALKKGGQTGRTIYSTSLFGNAYEYIAITPFAKYADFDSPSPLIKALGEAGAARLQAKLRKCIDSQTSYANTRLTDISNILDAPTEYIVTARYRIAPSKNQDFQALMKSDVLPVYKKAKVSLIVNQRGPGANPNEITMVTGLSKLADLDGGSFMTKQLGADGAAKLNAKFTGIRTLVEVVVRRRVAELSF
jgi:hypothetical protein